MKRYGFTLIELLVVVAVIAILAAIALPNLLEAQTRAKVSRAKSDIRSMATAMEIYRVDNNKYPPNFDAGFGTTYPTIPNPVTEYRSFATLTTPISYMSNTPSDPFRPDESNPGRDLYYEYYGADTVLTLPQYTLENKQYWTITGTKWGIYCVGPNRTYDLLGSTMNRWIDHVYDPTNGTVSFGDFGRTNVSVYPPS